MSALSLALLIAGAAGAGTRRAPVSIGSAARAILPPAPSGTIRSFPESALLPLSALSPSNQAKLAVLSAGLPAAALTMQTPWQAAETLEHALSEIPERSLATAPGRAAALERLWDGAMAPAAPAPFANPFAGISELGWLDAELAGSGISNERAVVLLSLLSLQHERWALDELEPAALRATRYAQASETNYEKALTILLRRVGRDEFAAGAGLAIESSLHGLHTIFHDPEARYKPHSDIAALGVREGRLAQEAVLGAHPVPANMEENGGHVNSKSLFGDSDFWRWAKKTDRALFDALVDRLLVLPQPFIQNGVYAKAELEPVGLLRRHFPAAYAVIRSARADFEPRARDPIRILPW